jgi:hypothetical protein
VLASGIAIRSASVAGAGTLQMRVASRGTNRAIGSRSVLQGPQRKWIESTIRIGAIALESSAHFRRPERYDVLVDPGHSFLVWIGSEESGDLIGHADQLLVGRQGAHEYENSVEGTGVVRR